MNRLEAARKYREMGFTPIPIPLCEKNPGFKGWQKYQPVNGQIERDFRDDGNIGLLLGEPSKGLIDIDLDREEARILAPSFLPETGMIGGRENAPRSHYWYFCRIKTRQFLDPNESENDRAMILEIRSTGAQTVVAPSRHPSGDSYIWHGDQNPSEVDPSILERHVSKLASCALLARYWTPGRRHHATMAISGTLFRNGWSKDEVVTFIQALAGIAGDEELEDRIRAVHDTELKISAGENVTGLPTLKEILGEKTVSAIMKWLSLSSVEWPQKSHKAASEQVETDTPPHPYKANGIGLVLLKQVRESGGHWGEIPVQLTNFVAEIRKDIIRDDGAEQTRSFVIRARLSAETNWKLGVVSASEFGSLQKWIHEVLGAKAVVFPAKSEHAKVAIQLLSEKIETHRVVAHTGWRNDDGVWAYYHVGGAIGAHGLIPAEVDLPASLSSVSFPDPPPHDRLRDMVLSIVQDLPKVASEKLMLPLIGSIWAAILTEADFSIFLTGYTGSGKSEIAALIQSFFGKGFHAKNLPGSWSSSANSLESLAHTAKDCILVIDDFCPVGTSAEQARLHSSADRVLRAQGNHSGRGRCRADGTVKPPKPPRGLIISTGEDLPRGQSLRARSAIIQIDKDSVDWDIMTLCQEHSRKGHFAQVTSAFIRWLARDNRIEAKRNSASEEIAGYRNKWLNAGNDSHKRNATTLAQIQRACDVWLEFAGDAGALDGEEIAGLREAVEIALDELGQTQSGYLASENPALRFIELLQAALISGKAHLAAIDESIPANPDICGWRNGTPQGECIGWIEGDNVYLQPDAAYKCAQTIGVNGEGLTVTSRVLWKRLREAGLLLSCESDDRHTIKKSIGKGRPRVLQLNIETLRGGI